MPPKRRGTPPKGGTRRQFSDWNLDKESSFTKAVFKDTRQKEFHEIVEEANFDNWERGHAVRVSERFKDKRRKRAEREHRRKELGMIHTWIFQHLSTCLGFELSEDQVQEAMIEGTNKDIIDKFIEENGSKVIMFLYQQVAVNHFNAGAHPSAVSFQ